MVELVTSLMERKFPALLARFLPVTVGVVANVSPFEVLLWGDPTSTEVQLKPSGYTPVEGHKVLVVWLGSQLVVVARLVAA